MENVKTKKNHPSLPSNYVTIADLRQRWLKQKQQENEEAEEEEEEEERQRLQDLQKQQQIENQHQQGEPVVVVRTRSTPGTRNAKQMQYQPKIRTDSGTNSRWIAVPSVGNAELESKGKESKKKWKRVKKRNPKVEEKEKETSEESESDNSEAKKSPIERELNEKEKNVEGNPNLEEKKKENEAIEESENSGGKKSIIEIELNEEKKDDSIVEKVEQKFGGSSVNSGNGKQVWRIERVNEGFDHSQPLMRNDYHFGGHHHDFSHRYGGFHCHNGVGNKVVWVRKDNAGGGEIEP